jgi:serine/threonine-protein kinase
MPGRVEDMSLEEEPIVTQARARVGRMLRDKWRLDALLGVGGMAAVYAATHRNGKRAAVKVLHVELSIDPNVRGRFLREGYVANKVGHPGAVSVLDDDVAEDGSVFLVMELLEGEALDARCTRSGGRLDAGEVLYVADQLLDVLAAAHDKGIVHRDIKPENVFVALDGAVKVLDFGIARVRELSSASTATKTGTSMGTPAYMPQEQARGRWSEVDARSDLWAVGATMFSALTGRLVHEAQTVNEQLLAAMTRQAPSLSAFGITNPSDLVAVVDRALAYDKNDRWPDARAMQHAVRVTYQALIGAPITTAPRLTVPEIAVAKTVASAPGSAQVAPTGDPVVSGRTGLGPARAATNRKGWTLVGLLSAGMVIALALLVALRLGSLQATGAQGSASVSAAATPTLAADADDIRPPPSVAVPASASVSPRADDAGTAPAATAKKGPPAPIRTAEPSKAAPPPAPPAAAPPPADMLDKRR